MVLWKISVSETYSLGIEVFLTQINFPLFNLSLLNNDKANLTVPNPPLPIINFYYFFIF